MGVSMVNGLGVEGVRMTVRVRRGARQTQVLHQIPTSHATLQTVLQTHAGTASAFLHLLIAAHGHLPNIQVYSLKQ